MVKIFFYKKSINFSRIFISMVKLIIGEQGIHTAAPFQAF